MQDYFRKFRNNIIGIDREFINCHGDSTPLVYADWTASGRCYRPIEQLISDEFLPFVANTHTETSTTGKGMTYAYGKAREIIKRHVNASSDDVLITQCSGMTGVINKFQRILGLKVHERFSELIDLKPNDRPIVFLTHMEHHSNQTSWLETIADVRIIEPDASGLVDLAKFSEVIDKYSSRKIKIAAVTSCSNVTGIFAPYHEIAKLMHRAGGVCFVDFACSAPYVEINMHPHDPEDYLDAIYFSPHKFLGGPGSSGILIFNKKLYNNKVPDSPGGGTVDWTNPWGEHKFVNDIEAREDGGTPAFLQTIRTSLAIKLKEEMGIANILHREHQLMDILWNKLIGVPNIHILAAEHRHRLAILSFYIDDLHYNLGVKILNDKFGIQARGGCSCAGTYGHFLLNVDKSTSACITTKINDGDYSDKPGWIRTSLHPTITDFEAEYIANAIIQLAQHHQEWSKDYHLNLSNSEIEFSDAMADSFIINHFDNCFDSPLH